MQNPKATCCLLFMGEDEKMVGENLSRTRLDFPGRQIDLLKALKATGKPVIVVLINGRPLAVNYSNRELDAILSAWFPGEFGGQAIAEILFGAYNPSARTSTTWPRSVGQIPINFPHKPWSQAGQAKSGPNGVGESRIVEPLYNFGFGLSYTTFEYKNLKIDNKLTTTSGKAIVSFELTNTGKRFGEDVPQLYVKDLVSSLTTYDWQLRGFKKIALKPGETKTVEFEILPEHLELINRKMKSVVEPGEFKFAIGRASDDFKLEETIKVN